MGYARALQGYVGSTIAKMGSPWVMPKTINNFFAEITKRDHKLSKTTFSLIKISWVNMFRLSFSVLYDASFLFITTADVL